MDQTFLLKIAKDPGCGLCNQLYALTGCIDHAIYYKNINIIIVDNFLKQINTIDYCPISEIVDMNAFNAYLLQYNIALIDRNYIHPTINSIVYENSQSKKIDITHDICGKFLRNSVLRIPITDILAHDASMLLVTYSLGGIPITLRYQMINGKLEKEVFLDFNFTDFRGSPQLYYGGSQNPKQFVSILQNMRFNVNFTSMVEALSSPFSNDTKINVIHLRLEEDAIASFTLQTKITNYKKVLEDKYIAMIKKYIEPQDLTIILSSEYNNQVIKFLDDENYNYIKTVNVTKYRELNGLIDLIIGEKCTNIMIGVYESSFSYTLMYRLFNNPSFDVYSVIIYMNDLSKSEQIYHKKSSLERTRHNS